MAAYFFSFGPRENEGNAVPFSEANSQLLTARFADLMAGTEERMEVAIAIILPHGGVINAHVYLRRDGFHFQTTSRIIIGGQGTVPGMRDVRHYTADCDVELRQTGAKEWRVGDKAEYFNDLYPYERLGTVTKTAEIRGVTAAAAAANADKAGAGGETIVADGAHDPAATVPYWKVCTKNLEDVGGSLSDLLYDPATTWTPCTSGQSESLTVGYDVEGRPPVGANLFDCAIACTIKYIDLNYATQTIVGLNGFARIRVLRRDLITQEAHDALRAQEEGCEECVICFEPILEQHACNILPCAHNKNAHAACIRHCETAQREIACPICREVVKVAPPPAQASKSFGRFG
jgi:hypothetical protein